MNTIASITRNVLMCCLGIGLLMSARQARAQDMTPVLEGMGYIQGVMEREAQRAAEAKARKDAQEDPLNMRPLQGVLAMDLEGTAYGMAIESPGRDPASQFMTSTAPHAIQACEAEHPRTPCQFVKAFNGECMAVAWSANSQHAFWHNAFMLRAAEKFAMEKCEKGGGNCRLVTTQCALQQGAGGQTLGSKRSNGTLPNRAELAHIRAQPATIGFLMADSRPTVLLSSLSNPYPGRGKQLTEIRPVKFLTLVNANRDQGKAVLGNSSIPKLPIHMFANTCAAVAVPGDLKDARDLIFAHAPTAQQAAELAEEQCIRDEHPRCTVSSFSDEESCSGNVVHPEVQETASGPVFGAIAIDQGANGVAVVVNQTSRAQAKQAVQGRGHFAAAFNIAQRAKAQAAVDSLPKVEATTFANACAGVAVPKTGARNTGDAFLFVADSAGEAAQGARSRCESVTGQACMALKIRQEKVCSGDYTKALVFSSDLKDYQ